VLEEVPRGEGLRVERRVAVRRGSKIMKSTVRRLTIGRGIS